MHAWLKKYVFKPTRKTLGKTKQIFLLHGYIFFKSFDLLFPVRKNNQVLEGEITFFVISMTEVKTLSSRF